MERSTASSVTPRSTALRATASLLEVAASWPPRTSRECPSYRQRSYNCYSILIIDSLFPFAGKQVVCVYMWVHTQYEDITCLYPSVNVTCGGRDLPTPHSVFTKYLAPWFMYRWQMQNKKIHKLNTSTQASLLTLKRAANLSEEDNCELLPVGRKTNTKHFQTPTDCWI